MILNLMHRALRASEFWVEFYKFTILKHLTEIFQLSLNDFRTQLFLGFGLKCFYCFITLSKHLFVNYVNQLLLTMQ